MATGGEIVLEGWVDKRGSRLHGWKKRYARLTYDRVIFSRDEQSEARGHWLLRDFIAVIKEATRFQQHPHCLCLVHPTSSNRYLEPASEQNVWLDCIQSLLQHSTPQIVLTRRVQRWLEMCSVHLVEGSLDMDAANPPIPEQPVLQPSNGPHTIPADEVTRKRIGSNSSFHAALDASPAVVSLNAQSDPASWNPASSKRTTDQGADTHGDDPRSDEEVGRSPASGARKLGPIRQEPKDVHQQSYSDEDDDDLDIRPGEDDDNYKDTRNRHESPYHKSQKLSMPPHLPVTFGFS